MPSSDKAAAVQALGREGHIPPNSVMIDIETTGPDTERNVIIQIGACHFNDRFDITAEFRRSLTPPPDRVDNEDTLYWWQRTDMALYQKIRSEAEPFMTVLNDFASWLPNPRGPLWGWPANYDLMYLFQYARMYCRRLLHWIHPSQFIDCRSWALGCRGKWMTAAEQEELFATPPPGCVIHDGLDDAKYQVECLRRLSVEVARRRAVDEESRYGLFREPSP